MASNLPSSLSCVKSPCTSCSIITSFSSSSARLSSVLVWSSPLRRASSASSASCASTASASCSIITSFSSRTSARSAAAAALFSRSDAICSVSADRSSSASASAPPSPPIAASCCLSASRSDSALASLSRISAAPSSALITGRLRMRFALWPNLSEESVSSSSASFPEHAITSAVRAFPPSDSWSSRVSFESR